MREDPEGTPGTAAPSLLTHGEVTHLFFHLNQVPPVLVGLPSQGPRIVGLKEVTDEHVRAGA